MKCIAFASGRGSNIATLIHAQRTGQLGGAMISGLIVNRPNCGALDHARSAQIEHALVDHKAYDSRVDFEDAVLKTLEPMQPDLIVLAGFMRILTPYFLDRSPAPIVNLHPALLPAFPGAHAIEDAFQAKVRVSGCSTHLVTADLDAGPVLMQGVVPLRVTDTLDQFRQRMQSMEYQVLPATIAALAQGDLNITNQSVTARPEFEACLSL